MLRSRSCWEAGHAEKHTICWKTCLVVKCLFFDGNGETYMKCWEAGHAEKHTICWKACLVVTLSCLFFWWKWWNLNAEKQVMLRSTKSAEKHVLLWNVFLTEMVKLKCWEAGHAEKHKTCWKSCFVVTCLFLMEKNNLMDVWLGNIQETPKLELKGMVDLFLYICWFSLCW